MFTLRVNYDILIGLCEKYGEDLYKDRIWGFAKACENIDSEEAREIVADYERRFPVRPIDIE